MGWQIKQDAVTGIMKFAFLDEDGETVASFRINPMDAKLANRLEEVSRFFAEQAENAPTAASMEDVVRYTDTLEEKIVYVIGKTGKDVFSVLSGTTVMPTGNLFAVDILQQIYDAVAPVIQERKQKMHAAMLKHTAKYQ